MVVNLEKINELEIHEMKKHIIISIFIIQQRWVYIINKKLENADITTKQWLMLIILSHTFPHSDKPPSMQELSEALSTSHQNVKQMAIRLEKRRFLEIKRDSQNRRISRLKITRECMQFWKKREIEDIESIKELLSGLDIIEIQNLFEIVIKLEKLSGKLYTDIKS